MENHQENLSSGNISKWSKDVEVLIKKVVKKNNFILVGSSMGCMAIT